ncbi:MAG: hypothetical protein RLZZ303_185 [Candidatus Hydrogenedentota bacterium]|jgi:hypothetical protein
MLFAASHTKRHRYDLLRHARQASQAKAENNEPLHPCAKPSCDVPAIPHGKNDILTPRVVNDEVIRSDA